MPDMSGVAEQEERGGGDIVSYGQQANLGAGSHIRGEDPSNGDRPTVMPEGDSPSYMNSADITGLKDNIPPGHEQSVKLLPQQQAQQPGANDSHHSNQDAVGVDMPCGNNNPTQTVLSDNQISEDTVISVDIKLSTEDPNVDQSVGQINGVNGSGVKGHKEASFVRTVQQAVKKLDHINKKPKKKMKKGIFISYSPDTDFLEKRFVVELVRQLKDNNLGQDIWFDKDENMTDSPVWFSQRMEAIEKARAAIIFMSDSYLACPVTVYESKVLLERHQQDSASIAVFMVNLGLAGGSPIRQQFHNMAYRTVDVSAVTYKKMSTAEIASVVVGSLMTDLDEYASIRAPPTPSVAPDSDFTGEYKSRKISQWAPNDLQEWLFKLGIKEFYRQNLAENMIDGFLLMALTDKDMSTHLSIDSRVVRKKIMQQVLTVLDKEHRRSDSWHLRARTQKPRPDCVYLIYDPNDVRLAQNFKHDLAKKGLQVTHHQKLGNSKEEFLQENAAQMATASHVIILLTEPAINSPFVFHEVLFADWLGKKLLTAVFRNMWFALRPSLKAVLGECPAVDFESQMYRECMDVLVHHVKPIRTLSGVVLEQSYLNKMAEGIQPLALLALTAQGGGQLSWMDGAAATHSIFISHHWDVQTRVEQLQSILETSGFSSWADTSTAALGSPVRGPGTAHPARGARHGTRSASFTEAADSLQTAVYSNIRSAGLVMCCITPKYLQSERFVQDMSHADTLGKPIIPILLHFCPWPPEAAPSALRKVLYKLIPVDLSNDKLFKLNLNVLIDRIKKSFSAK